MNRTFVEEKVFKDPVHDYIYVHDAIVWNVINTKAFQRLRRIKVMGTSYMTYHGAEHSRFTHSLGAYEVMRKVLSHFRRNHQWPKDDRTRLLALVSALVHDIGHGPFSHSIESVFGCEHEWWTKKLLAEDAEMQQVLSTVDNEFAADVIDVIDKSDRFSGIVKLLSSQLDVDRMDYLLRDAFYTGVIYGRFELERLIRVMRPYRGDVYVKRSGVHTVEQYILARYFMYSQVYLHPLTLGSDALLQKLLERAKVLYGLGQLSCCLPELVPFFEGGVRQMTVEEYQALDEPTIVYQIRRWNGEPDAILADLANRFIHRNLFHASPCRVLEPKDLQRLSDAFLEAGWEPDYYMLYRSSTTDGYVYKEGIQCTGDEGESVDISAYSNLVRALRPETVLHLYYPKEIVSSDSPASAHVAALISEFSLREN